MELTLSISAYSNRNCPRFTSTASSFSKLITGNTPPIAYTPLFLTPPFASPTKTPLPSSSHSPNTPAFAYPHPASIQPHRPAGSFRHKPLHRLLRAISALLPRLFLNQTLLSNQIPNFPRCLPRRSAPPRRSRGSAKPSRSAQVPPSASGLRSSTVRSQRGSRPAGYWEMPSWL